MAFNGERLNKAHLLDGYEHKDFPYPRTEESYMTQVLQPFVETVKQVGQTGYVLDLASGGGETADFFRKSGLQVVQLDLSPFALEKAHGVRVLGRAENLPFQDATFDAIHMKDAVVHIGDIDELFGEMVRLLVPGGRVLILSAYFSSEQNSFRVWRKDSDGNRKRRKIKFDTPEDYTSKVRTLLQDSTVIKIAPPHYPYSSGRLKAAATANQLVLEQESSWVPTSSHDWYKGNRERFVLQFGKSKPNF